MARGDDPMRAVRTGARARTGHGAGGVDDRILWRVRSHWPLLPSVVVAVVANCWALTSVGWGNSYYAAAVRSMTTGWKAFLFGSLDPESFVSVDKPPLSLWVQAISAKLFGYSQLSLLAPQALAGVLAVVVLYAGVQMVWGRRAAAIAAAALAVTPINVMITHSNNTDAILVLVMTAGAVVAMRATATGRLRWFLAACLLAGTAMTAKMLAALPVMPGLLLAYGWCAPRSWKVRVAHVGVGAAVMAAAGLWWFALVDLTPKEQRPYVGSSATNSAFQLAFERNGVNQVEGSQAATGTRQGGGLPPPGAIMGPGGGFSMPMVGFDGGRAEALRLFNEALGAQASWTIPLALIGSVAALVLVGLRGSAKLAALVIFGGWFASAGVVFSMTEGLLHPYYLANLGPPLAALTGIAASALRDLIVGRGWLRGVGLVLGVAAFGTTAFAQWTVLGYGFFAGWRPWLRPGAVAAIVVLGAGGTLAAVLVRVRGDGVGRGALASVSAGVAAALIAPALLTQSALAHPLVPQLPFASIDDLTSGGGSLAPNGGFTFPAGDQAALIAFLRASQRDARWAVAVQSAGQAEALIINDGLAVMALGGFTGSDPILTAATLRRRISNGDVRFFLLSATTAGGRSVDVPSRAGGSVVATGPGLGGLLPGPTRQSGDAPVPSESGGRNAAPTVESGDALGPSGLGGLLPGPSGDAGGGPPVQAQSRPGASGRAGNTTTAFVAVECAEVPQQSWRGAGDQELGVQSFPGGPTSSTFTLYDCASLRS